ncbi:MAG: glycosyltransferase family 2 protein [Candidatus Solibacter usitatus]|nr:glycosyltransferase family 2 protein [Candidatus Solibacter usitatus]
MISIVTPSFQEARSLPLLYSRLSEALKGLDWEWIAVDDHSNDGSFAALRELAAADPRVRGVRLARRSGSHAAITCGLERARGEAAVVMAADLEDPPEAVLELVEAWRQGAQVVWAECSGPAKPVSSRLYHRLVRRLAGIGEMPASGSDFFLLDRGVMDAFARFGEGNTSVFALVAWMGFRQARVRCEKQPRVTGRSGWTRRAKLKLLADSVTAFSLLPVRAMSVAGFLAAVSGFAYAALVAANYFAGKPPQGWSSLMVAVLVMGGLQMLMLGVLGEYIWRALEESRRRPRYLVEEET